MNNFSVQLHLEMGFQFLKEKYGIFYFLLSSNHFSLASKRIKMKIMDTFTSAVL
jgi:hypothetical protein